jgi:hypothetical protein
MGQKNTSHERRNTSHVTRHTSHVTHLYVSRCVLFVPSHTRMDLHQIYAPKSGIDLRFEV